jgi:hypothetical protein
MPFSALRAWNPAILAKTYPQIGCGVAMDPQWSKNKNKVWKKKL